MANVARLPGKRAVVCASRSPARRLPTTILSLLVNKSPFDGGGDRACAVVDPRACPRRFDEERSTAYAGALRNWRT
jgi:hypothetical protein